MKNKKGFTLIELLAVIVVLAIIALIATPIVMNTIRSARKGAAERSVDSYIDAVETAVATSILDGKEVSDGTYTIDSDGNLTGTGLPNGKLTIDMNGNKPKSGTITIKDGQVTNDSTMTIGDYDVKYNEDKKKYEATEKDSSSSTVVYRWSTNTINIGDTIDPSDTTKFTKDPSTLEQNYYLKHILDKDNRVTKSYACAKFEDKEYCLTNGEYGWSENEADYTGNALILKKIEREIISLDDTSFENISCTFNEGESKCNYLIYVGLYANNDELVYAQDEPGQCSVDGHGGSSYCESY